VLAAEGRLKLFLRYPCQSIASTGFFGRWVIVIPVEVLRFDTDWNVFGG
jgi:hypothetical protein